MRYLCLMHIQPDDEPVFKLQRKFRSATWQSVFARFETQDGSRISSRLTLPRFGMQCKARRAAYFPGGLPCKRRNDVMSLQNRYRLAVGAVVQALGMPHKTSAPTFPAQSILVDPKTGFLPC